MGIFLDSFTKQIFKSRIRLTIGYGFLGLLKEYEVNEDATTWFMNTIFL